MTTGAVDQGVRACIFVLGAEPFAVDVSCAREVAVIEQYTIVPRAPAYLIGVANVRGTIVPLVDIRSLLSLPAHRSGPGTKALVVEDESSHAGLVIDDVLGVESFEELIPFGDTARRDWAEFGIGLVRRAEALVTVLDAGKILGALSIGGSRRNSAEGMQQPTGSTDLSFGGENFHGAD